MEISDSLRQQLNHWILPGFMTLDEVHEAVDDNELEDEYSDDDPHAAAEQVWKERKAQEPEWEHPTDYDRVQAAFDEMEEQGLVTGMSLGFDVSDCNELLGEERTQIDVPEGEYSYREWASCGFHMQDAEGLAYGPTELYLVSVRGRRARRSLVRSTPRSCAKAIPSGRTSGRGWTSLWGGFSWTSLSATTSRWSGTATARADSAAQSHVAQAVAD